MRHEPTKDLLFGLLALQNGLINQGALVAAFQAWSLEKTKGLPDHLESRGDVDAEDRKSIELPVSRHIKKHGGEVEKSLASIHIGQSFKSTLGTIGGTDFQQTLSQIGPVQADGEALRTTTYEFNENDAGQRFQVLRPHARGGFGEVFVALDAQLNREVALKQILGRHADQDVSRRRFLHEAEITGGLEHPGIVQVYGLGSYTDGRPYYAMRFVRGDTMKEAAKSFHSTTPASGRNLHLQQLLRRFLSVCDVIEYAHRRGVIHRDIKPANIILGKHGERLVVDWGLTKAIGRDEPRATGDEKPLVPASGNDSSETLPGVAIGTPAFMSPEQASGDLEMIDTASDVYSLGATLYFILTGKPAFEGPLVDVIRAFQKESFKRPRATASWVDPTLELICLKAMAHNSRDRYPSARALAIDLERYIADEPVSAIREPIRARVARWERKHKTLVYGCFLSLAILAFVLAVVASAVSNQNRISEQTREEAERQAGVAETNRNMAIDVAFTFLNTVSDQTLSQIPSMTSARLDLARRAAESFDKFL